ncbi:MAG: hypothetical protein ACO3EP_10145 [Phycisphaerales bacterium]
MALHAESDWKRLSSAIAVAPAANSLASETLPWLGFFAGVAIVAWLIAHWLRRALRRETRGPLGGFETEALERMRRDGELTEEQIRAIRRAAALSAARKPGPETADSGPGTDRGHDRSRNGPPPS